jgi:hypothetical protein
MPLAPHPTSIVASGAISLNHDQAGIGSNGFFPSIDPAGLNEIVEVLETPSDEVLTSDLTPAPDGGRFLSHSHRLDHVEAHSFVSAWDLYLLEVRRAFTVIGSSEDPEECLRNNVCACVCVCVCASPVEDEPQTVPSMIVPVESSQ